MSKKKKKQEEQEQAQEIVKTQGADVRDILELRRTAKETKNYKVITRVLALVIIILILIVSATYAVSYFYDKFGSFTVKINKYDMVRQGLALSETPDYDVAKAVLNADILYNMTNISGEDLPENIDKINGCHNGDNYIAYTFYLINSGDSTLTYTGEMDIDNVTKKLDEAVRVAVYKNGEKTVYGKTKSNGGGMESDCDSEFEASTIVMKTSHEKFEPKAKDKYTVVVWVEGNDPDCTDEVVGGTLSLSLNFKIVEST